MDKLVHCCFSVQRDVSEDIDKLVRSLEKAVANTGVTITLKLHVILAHIKECMDFFEYGQGLGAMSEQSGETINHEFDKIWSKYKINTLTDSSYPTRLKRAVTEFSSFHL